MITLYKKNLYYLIIYLLAPIFFHLGYLLKSLLGLNNDIFFTHSFLLFVTVTIFTLIDVFINNKKFNKYVRLINISILSCSFFGIILSIIQNDIINTRWLEFGRFPVKDAVDYVNQSVQYLFENELYSVKGRVIFPIIYAGFLAELDLNIYKIQYILSLLAAIVTFTAAILIFEKFGYIYSLIFSGLSVDYLLEHMGGVCTELVGYILGAIAFIFFIRFRLDFIKKIKYFYLFLFFILLGYLIRPSLPLLLPVICLWAIYYATSIKISKPYIIMITTVGIFFSIFLSNRLLTEIKSPNSPKEFGNVYDSWYATHELGKFFLEGKYKELPPLLWTRIIETNPELISLEGEEVVSLKKKIFYESLIQHPENYLVGSVLQIVKFFEVSKFFKEQYHNTGGFLHIEFFGLRVIIILLFSIAGIISVYKFIKFRKIDLFLPGLIVLSTILSQPFIFGGEARTAAPIILFLNYVIITFLFDLNIIINKNKSLSEGNKVFLISFYDTKFYIILILVPFFILTYFFLSGLLNKNNFFEKNIANNINCPTGYQPKLILFNKQSGFFINSSGKKILSEQKDFSDYLDYVANLAIIHYKFGADVSIKGLTFNEILERDKFKFLTPFLTFTDTRLATPSERDNSLLALLGKQYLANGGFFINPINVKTGKTEGIVILKENMVHNGMNKLITCL